MKEKNRAHQWKMRRQKQLRRRVTGTLLTVLLMLGIVFFCGRITNAQEKSGDIAYKYYTSIEISSGDSLWSIAEKYRDDHYDSIQDYMDEVVSINHIGNRNRLISGQFLVIPYYSDEYKP